MDNIQKNTWQQLQSEEYQKIPVCDNNLCLFPCKHDSEKIDEETGCKVIDIETGKLFEFFVQKTCGCKWDLDENSDYPWTTVFKLTKEMRIKIHKMAIHQNKLELCEAEQERLQHKVYRKNVKAGKIIQKCRCHKCNINVEKKQATQQLLQEKQTPVIPNYIV